MKKFFIFLVFIFNIVLPNVASAATSSIRTDAFNQLNAASGDSGAGFGSYTDPRELAAKIIKSALGVLGIIFMVLALYAGFLWMTAAGNDEQVGTARKLLYNAAIGLGVILASLSITYFVFDVLLKGTTGEGLAPGGDDICLQDPTNPNCAM